MKTFMTTFTKKHHKTILGATTALVALLIGSVVINELSDRNSEMAPEQEFQTAHPEAGIDSAQEPATETADIAPTTDATTGGAQTASGADAKDAATSSPVGLETRSDEQDAIASAAVKQKPTAPSAKDLVALLKSRVDLDDPTALAEDMQAENLVGQAYGDFWGLFKNNSSRGVLAQTFALSGHRFYLVTDTPEGGGCNYYYDREGSYLVSVCGSDETAWNWRFSDKIVTNVKFSKN